MSLKDLVFAPLEFAQSAFGSGPEYRSLPGQGGAPPVAGPVPVGTPPAAPQQPAAPVFKNRTEEAIYLRGLKLALIHEARNLGDRIHAERRALAPEEEQRLVAIETQMADINTRLQACEAAMQTTPAVPDAGSNGLPRPGQQSRSYDDFIGSLERSYQNPGAIEPRGNPNPAPQYQQPPQNQPPVQYQQPQWPTQQPAQQPVQYRATTPIPAGAATINYMHSYGGKSEQELRRNVLQGWAGSYSCNFDRDQRRMHAEAAEVLGVDLRSKTLAIPLDQDRYDQIVAEKRVMTAASATLGSKSVPTTLIDRVVERMVAMAPVRKVADQWTSETGVPLPYPTIDDSANKGRIRAAETTAGTKTDVVIGQKSYGCAEFASDIVLVSNKLIRDSIINLERRLGTLLPARIARQQTDKFTTGSGTDEPEGIVTGATLGWTAPTQTVFTRRDLIKLKNSLDQAYHPGASWQFNLIVLEALELMEDTTGEPLFQEISAGAPPLLLGYPWMLNQSMAATITATSYPIVFGDFKLGYSIRDVGQLILSRSEEYAWDSEQLAFKAIMSSDGRVVDPYAIMKMQMAA